MEAAHSALCCSIYGLAGLAGQYAAQGFEPQSKTYAHNGNGVNLARRKTEVT
jgi:hypothetical protein